LLMDSLVFTLLQYPLHYTEEDAMIDQT